MPPYEEPRATPGQALARLSVDGPLLVWRVPGQPTRPVRLRGINRSGLQHKPSLAAAGWTDARAELRAWREHWQAQVLRLPLNLDSLRPGSAYEADVDALVAAAGEVGLYLMLELHATTHDLNPVLPPIDRARPAWVRLAVRHGAQPHVIFDLWNEPHPETLLGRSAYWRLRGPWEMWRELAQGLINAIRAAGATDTLLIVGGVDWAYDLSPLRRPGARLQGHGPLAYATHVYPFKGRQWPTRWAGWRHEWRRAFGRVAEELPVLVTEFGSEPAGASDAYFPNTDADSARAWVSDLLAYVDELGLSALAWSAGDRPHLVLAPNGAPPADLGRDGIDPWRPTEPFGALVRAWLQQSAGEPPAPPDSAPTARSETD
jgi:hypothetical protein